MDVERLRDALNTGRPVWVEIWNGQIGRDIYTPGKSLVAGEDPHHQLMFEPVPGDAVVHIKAAGAKGKLIGLSTVAKKCRIIPYREKGKIKNVYYIKLRDDVHFEVPLQPFKDQFKEEIINHKDPRTKHYPFAKNLSLAERGYLKRATSGLTSLFISTLATVPTLVDASYPLADDEMDIADIKSRNDIPETTKQALVAARLGQGGFRAALDKLWNGRCSIRGFSTRELLRASHIKKWSESTDKERLDPNNGLLLSAHLDALFDKGLISFDQNGKMLVSKKVPAFERGALLRSAKLRQRPWDELNSYLSIHRNAYGFSK
jgi:HNH endonuclease